MSNSTSKSPGEGYSPGLDEVGVPTRARELGPFGTRAVKVYDIGVAESEYAWSKL